MQCFIYRCNLKQDMYIYLVEEDNFENVPKEIYDTLGIVEFSMELDITPETKLAREETAAVLNNLKEHGFHIQLSSNESVEEVMARIAEKNNKKQTKTSA